MSYRLFDEKSIFIQFTCNEYFSFSNFEYKDKKLKRKSKIGMFS